MAYQLEYEKGAREGKPMAKDLEDRIYTRNRGGEDRYYVDLRDMGGGREALKPVGDTRATGDPTLARKLARERVEELEEREARRRYLGLEGTAELEPYAAAYLRQRAREGKLAESTLSNLESYLEAAVGFFGQGRDLTSIRPPDVKRWIGRLRKRPNGMGGTLSDGTVRKYLNALSNLYRYAESDGLVPSGFNPVASLVNKPSADRQEARWMEIPEAALYLEAARTFEPERKGDALSGQVYPLVATFLLTGGRKSEVLGLDVEDVSFDRRKIRFRPNAHRGLKTSTSHRTVPMWPQLHDVLQRHVFGGSGPATGLLFPSRRTGGMIHDLRKTLDKVAKRAGIGEGEIRSRIFRHTYCAARLQTFDGYRVLGEDDDGNELREPIPVSRYTVAKEMGHGGTQLVERVYGHLGEIRQRRDVVEYVADDYTDDLGERLEAVRAG